ncbi:UNVERIFIED_CONTAM: hypothetical protein GTU68_053969 [Idotea baltica]|nr:hypothetical protein [Idotea baltica]
MLKKLSLVAVSAMTIATGAFAAGDAGHIEDFDFSYEGPFGTYDQNQLQRGLHIYTDVCAGCHGLKFVPMRTLADKGGPMLPEDQMKAYTKAYPINDELANPQLFDKDTEEYPVENQGAPDLSLMAKARSGFHGPYGLGINQFVNGIGGAEYIASILTGYTGEEKEEAGTTFYENTAFPGGWIAMAPPLYGEDVDFADGHSNDLHHEAEDIAAFLRWTAEPHQDARKRTGFVAVLLMVFLTVMLYLANKRIWAPIKRKR